MYWFILGHIEESNEDYRFWWGQEAENRLFINIYITVESKKSIYGIPFKKQGWDYVEIWGLTWNYFFF